MKLLFDFSEAKVSAPDEYATVVAGIVVAVAFACFAKGYRSEIDYTTLYRFITPTVILLALAVALSQADHQSYEAFFIGGVWTFYKIFSWSLWRNISYRVTYPDSAVFSPWIRRARRVHLRPCPLGRRLCPSPTRTFLRWP